MQPLVASCISSAAFFSIVLIFFRLGYAANDDISTILLASGYLGGKPLPFLVHSNVLLGFFLQPLYRFLPRINWEVFLFIAINFLSVWALIYLFLTRLSVPVLRAFAVIAVIICDVYILINITYTMIAAFAALAGLCLVLSAVQSPTALQKGRLMVGCALILVSSLIRLNAMLLIGGLSLPVFVLLFHPAQFKKQVIALSLMGVLVLSAVLFDSLYVQTFPGWNSFRAYDLIRAQLHDTPRKFNIEPAYPQIGWSRNDVKTFFDWFFPDKKIYSLENLQYLVKYVPDKQKSKIGTLIDLSSHLLSPVYLPYFLIIFSTGLLALFYGLAKRASAALLGLLAVFFGLDFYLTWAMKTPDRVLIPLLAGTTIFSLHILIWAGTNGSGIFSKTHQDHKNMAGWFICITLPLAAAFGLILNQSIATTIINSHNQAAYQSLLVDLKNLQDNGKISKHALIISPSYGFPLEWANPLSVNLPNIQVLEMGWLTFSPAYDEVLQAFDAQPIPDSFYKKDNVYLMSPQVLLSGILDFIKEHKGLDTDGLLIYRIPGTDTGLYQLRQKPTPVPRVP